MGAEVRTTQGETCKTPCELTVPSHEQTITKNNYVPQTVQITLGPQPDHSFWENPPPTLVPNPVRVVSNQRRNRLYDTATKRKNNLIWIGAIPHQPAAIVALFVDLFNLEKPPQTSVFHFRRNSGNDVRFTPKSGHC
jgi:hypothetical protein